MVQQLNTTSVVHAQRHVRPAQPYQIREAVEDQPKTNVVPKLVIMLIAHVVVILAAVDQHGYLVPIIMLLEVQNVEVPVMLAVGVVEEVIHLPEWNVIIPMMMVAEEPVIRLEHANGRLSEAAVLHLPVGVTYITVIIILYAIMK